MSSWTLWSLELKQRRIQASLPWHTLSPTTIAWPESGPNLMPKLGFKINWLLRQLQSWPILDTWCKKHSAWTPWPPSPHQCISKRTSDSVRWRSKPKRSSISTWSDCTWTAHNGNDRRSFSPTGSTWVITSQRHRQARREIPSLGYRSMEASAFALARHSPSTH